MNDAFEHVSEDVYPPQERLGLALLDLKRGHEDLPLSVLHDKFREYLDMVYQQACEDANVLLSRVTVPNI